MNYLSNDIVNLSLLESSQPKFYRLLLVISSLETLKTRILLVLSHLYPKRLNATELSLLLGYSKKSRALYRGVLDEMEQEELLSIERITQKHFSIQLNNKHPLMQELIELCLAEGESQTNNLIDKLSRF